MRWDRAIPNQTRMAVADAKQGVDQTGTKAEMYKKAVAASGIEPHLESTGVVVVTVRSD